MQNKNWDVLDKNLIVQIALDLDLPDILRTCQVNKRFNEAVCDSDNFWYKRLIKDYPDFKPDGVEGSKGKYELLSKPPLGGFSSSSFPIREAASKEFEDLVSYYINKGSGYGMKKDFIQAVNGAASSGNLRLVHKYFDSDNEYPEYILTNILRNAVEGGNINVVNYLIKNTNDEKNVLYTAMSAVIDDAARLGHLNIVELLIKKGAGNWNYAYNAALKNEQYKIAYYLKPKFC